MYNVHLSVPMYLCVHISAFSKKEKKMNGHVEVILNSTYYLFALIKNHQCRSIDLFLRCINFIFKRCLRYKEEEIVFLWSNCLLANIS